jgi:hypothetical protein
MLSATPESRCCSVILVLAVLHLEALRTFISITILISGAIVFGCDASKFALFSMCSLPGTTVLAGGLFLVGASLWVGD